MTKIFLYVFSGQEFWFRSSVGYSGNKPYYESQKPKVWILDWALTGFMSSGDSPRSLGFHFFICKNRQDSICFPYRATLVFLYQVKRYIWEYFVNYKAHILYQMGVFLPSTRLYSLWGLMNRLFLFVCFAFCPNQFLIGRPDTVFLQGLKGTNVTMHFFLNHTAVILPNNLYRRNFAKWFYIHVLG